MSKRRPPRSRLFGWIGRFAVAAVAAVCLYLAASVAGLCLLRIADPPITGVQLQRAIEARLDGAAYARQYEFVPLSAIGEHLQHAVIVAEDGRFHEHGGVDWLEIEKYLHEELPRGRVRGASTITQQLVKNLFMTTHANPLRKPVEFLLAPVAERVLGKQRILELYLNVVEWGPGIYGAEAAARHHYHRPASGLTREQAARLAACLPSPLRRRPSHMNEYSAQILHRMESRHW